MPHSAFQEFEHTCTLVSWLQVSEGANQVSVKVVVTGRLEDGNSAHGLSGNNLTSLTTTKKPAFIPGNISMTEHY